MIKHRGMGLLVALVLFNCIPMMALGQPEEPTVDPSQLVATEMSGHGISWQVFTEVESIRLKVAGESGLVTDRRFGPSDEFWYDLTQRDGSFLTDGSYTYELIVARKTGPEETRLRWEAEEFGTEPLVRLPPVAFRAGGNFQVIGGRIETNYEVPEPIQPPQLPDVPSPVRGPMDEITGDFYVDGGLCTGCLESTFGLIPYGDANIRSGLCVGSCGFGNGIPDGVLQVRGNAPYIHLDTISSGDWHVRSSAVGFQISEIGSPFSLIEFTMKSGLPVNSFYLDSEGLLGLGTSLPEEELHIIGKGIGGDPAIRFEATGTAEQEYEWSLIGSERSFSIRDVTEARTPFLIEPGAPTASFKMIPSGNVGLGAFTPDAPLHVERSDGNARILVVEEAAAVAVRTQFHLQNNGAPRFALENTSSGIEWSFQQSRPGNFLISKEGTGGPELQVYQNGRVRMGPAGAINFDLTPSGDLTIAGSLTANGSVFPDYVFEPEYKLMPLSELSAFIEEEKRLPKIPSAKEIQKKGGHNMTELQLQLLEKIEELTLYTLEQEQRIRTLENQVKEMGGFQN